MKAEDLVTYCGAYCGTCARWREYTAFREAAALLAEVADAHGFQRWIPRRVTEFNYAEFRRGVEFFRGRDTWFVCQKPCKQDPAVASCKFRRCCERRGIGHCFDCAEFPCKHNKNNSLMIERAKEYRKLGRQAWLRLLAKRAAQGFEHHTKKCYRVSAAERPPSRPGSP